MKNSFFERFNRSFREEILDAYLFSTLNEVRELSSRWIHVYNEERPHGSLGNLTPVEHRRVHEAGQTSSLNNSRRQRAQRP
jgi:putative transposase